MKIKTRRGFYLVENSKGDDFYRVSLEDKTCECPNFIYRLKRAGMCKHLKAVQELVEVDAKDDFEKALDYVGEGIDSIDFIERFSEGLLNELIGRGELIEKNGKIMRI